MRASFSHFHWGVIFSGIAEIKKFCELCWSSLKSENSIISLKMGAEKSKKASVWYSLVLTNG
jgi:hypothetical protein